MSIKTSDEILNELFDSLNLPLPPVKNAVQDISNERLKENALRKLEVYDEDESEFTSLSDDSLDKGSKEVGKNEKKDKKKKKKKHKDHSKSRHKRKRSKSSRHSSDDELDRKGSSHHKSYEKIARSSERDRSHSNEHGSYARSSKSRRRSRSCDRSKYKDLHSHSGSISRSRHARSERSSRHHDSHSPSPTRECKRQRGIRDQDHSHSFPKNAKSKSPIENFKDPLDEWKSSKLATLKKEIQTSSSIMNSISHIDAMLHSSRKSESNQDTVDDKVEIIFPKVNSGNVDCLGMLKDLSSMDIPKDKLECSVNTIPLPDIVSLESPSAIPLPVPSLLLNSELDKDPTINDDDGKPDSKDLYTCEPPSKNKEENKLKTIVIKNLKDSVVFQKLQDEFEKKSKDQDEPVDKMVTSETKVCVNKGSLDDEEISKIGSSIDAILKEIEEESLTKKALTLDVKKEVDNHPVLDDCDIANKNESKIEISKNDSKIEIAIEQNDEDVKSSVKDKHNKEDGEKHKEKSWRYKDIPTSKERSKRRSKKSSRRSRSNSRHRRRRSRSRSHHKHKDKKRRSRSRSHSRSRKRHSAKEKDREKLKKSSSPDCVDSLRDKATRKRLLEVARKNAMHQMRKDIPAGMEREFTSSGRSVEELTDFCKQLVAKGDYGEEELSDPSLSPDYADNDNSFPNKRHPFSIVSRDSKPIMMNIRNGPMLPIKTNAERFVDSSKLREQFPVSCGSQHRTKEGHWVVVEKEKKDEDKPKEDEKVFPDETPSVDISNIVSSRLSALRMLQSNPNDTEAKNVLSSSEKEAAQWAMKNGQKPGQFTGSTGVRILSVQELSSGMQAWAKKEQFREAIPVKSHFGMKMLQKMGWNPGEGLGKNKEGQLEPLVLDVKMDKKGLSASKESKNRNRNAKILKRMAQLQNNLSGAPSVYQGRNSIQHRLSGPPTATGFTQSRPAPMISAEERLAKLQERVVAMHPVAALMEVCRKSKYPAPIFHLVHDSGPDHKKSFLMKVVVNNIDYTSPNVSLTKKMAKSNAAITALRALNLMPPQLQQQHQQCNESAAIPFPSPSLGAQQKSVPNIITIPNIPKPTVAGAPHLLCTVPATPTAISTSNNVASTSSQPAVAQNGGGRGPTIPIQLPAMLPSLQKKHDEKKNMPNSEGKKSYPSFFRFENMGTSSTFGPQILPAGDVHTQQLPGGQHQQF